MKATLFFSNDWHIKKEYSKAFYKTIINVIKDYINIEFHVKEGKYVNYNLFDSDIFIFCHQFMHNDNINNHNKRIFYMPMYDNFRDCVGEWYEIPKDVIVLSYCREIDKICTMLGLKYLSLQYYEYNENQVNFNNGKILYFFDRHTNLISVDFLKKFVDILNIDKVLYHISDKNKFINDDKYENIYGWFNDHNEYKNIIKDSNIIICPRCCEGMGLTFIEEISRGCIPFAYDAPTMNEYIIHKFTGYLFKSDRIVPMPNSINKSINIEDQNWNEISKLDLEKLSNNVYNNSYNGYKKWIDNKKELIKLLIGL